MTPTDEGEAPQTTPQTETSTDDTAEQQEEDLRFITGYVDEAETRLAQKLELRTANLNAGAARPGESHFGKLDSSLKRNTAFVKKVRNFSATQIESYLRDMRGLNLTKYLSEVAAAVVDAKLKMSDVPGAVQLCSILHQTYNEFSQHLFDNWQKALGLLKPTSSSSDKQQSSLVVQNPSKLRVDLRFYAELVASGLFINKNAFTLLGTVLTTLVNVDKDEHFNVSIVLSFCRHCGEDYAGLVPRRVREVSSRYNVTVPKSSFLLPEKQHNVRALLREYYSSLARHLLRDHREMREYERQNRRIMRSKGELSAERRDRLETLQVNFDKLLASTHSFAELLDEDVPSLPVEPSVPRDEDTMIVTGLGNPTEQEDLAGGPGGTMVPLGGGGGDCVENVWGDTETQRFYRELPELQVFLPTSFLQKEKDKAEVTIEPEAAVTEETLDQELPPDEDIVEDDGKTDEPPTIEDETEDSTTTTTVSNKIVLEAFLSNLPNCVNREMIDNAAIDFLVTLNSKHNRRKLTRALFGVNRTRLDLLPFYARFVAILRPAVAEVSNDLCQLLRHDFKYQVRKKDQINIESKIKVVRYIGELVKFDLYSKIEALYCLKVLLHDFSHHHIEMACNLLEVCGRYLYCSADSHQRTKVYLEQMMRKKSVMALDSRYVTQIENAYYYVNPPETVPIAQKIRPVMHQFVRKLLYQDLHKTTTDKVMRLIRKLDWSCEETAAYAIKCLAGAHNIKYLNIRCLANLLSGLVAYQEEVGTRVVDAVLEDIRLGMEVNSPRFNQRRVAQIKYLGELYNYRMIESADVFKVLYSLITFGVSMDVAVPSPLDPPDHLFRIRLACVLLETCGTYFNSGNSKKRLDYYLVFLQAYYWYKKNLWGDSFPPPLEHLFRDTLQTLRPKLKMFQNYDEAMVECNNIRTGLGIENIQEASNQTSDGGLENIPETDNEDQGDDETSEGGATATEDDTTTLDHTHESCDEEDELSDPEAAEETEAVPSAPRRIECPEDDEFMSALDRMVSENIQERMREPVKATNVDISVPVVLRSSKKATYEQLQRQLLQQQQRESDEPTDKKGTMPFVLMVRKGNKQQYKQFEADIDSELAQNLRDQEVAQREEKERVKRLTLNITERFEEEDYQEMLQQQGGGGGGGGGSISGDCGGKPFANLNRERKKYQHPRGAPDADLIFGPKRTVR